MKRYPHSAILTIRAEPEIVNGKRMPDITMTFPIIGRYDAKDTSLGEVKKNSKGDEVLVSGEFYTKHLPYFKGIAISIKVLVIGIDKPVLDITPYQSYTVITV